MMSIRITFMLLLIFSGTIAQSSYHIGLADGLGTKAVTDITMDNQGCMWIATYGGIYRHEGSRIRQLKDGNTLNIPIEKTEFHTVFQDQGGRILAGSLNGVYTINPYTFEAYRHFILPEDAGAVSVGGIYSVFEDHEKNIWLSSDDGLYRKNRSESDFKKIPSGNDANSVPGYVTGYKTAVLTPEGMWLYTTSGMVFYNKRKQYFEHEGHNPSKRRVFNLPFNKGIGAASYTIKGYKNDIWFVANHKWLTRYDYVKDLIDTIPIPENLSRWSCCQTLALDGEDGMWIGFRHGGLFYYDFQSKEFEHYKNDGLNDLIASNYINSLTIDYQGRLWVGSDNGINIIDRRKKGVERYTISTDKEFKNLKYQIGTLSFGCDNNLYIPYAWFGFYKKSGDNNLPPLKVNNTISTGASYFKYCDGYNEWYGSSKIFTHSNRAVTTNLHNVNTDYINDILDESSGQVIWMHGDDSGYVFIKKNNGLLYYFHKSGYYQKMLCPGFKLNLKLSDSNSILWYLGVNATLIRRNIETGREDSTFLKSYLHSKDWAFTNTRSIEEDDKSVWITSQNGLLRYYYAGDSISVYTTLQGISSSFTFSVIKDRDGGIWVTSLSGIDKYDDQTNSFVNVVAWPIESYMDAFGSSVMDRNGKLHFAIGNKYVTIQPENINIENSEKSKLIFTQLSINGDNIDFSDKNNFARLSHNQNRILLRYGLLKFIRPRDCKILYRFSGLGQDWIEDDTYGELSFNTLSPDLYNLEIKAVDMNGRDISDTALLSFIIYPHFSQSVWFRTALVFCLFLVVYLFYRFRLNQQMKIQMVRNKIAADLHDDVASTVSSLSYYSEFAKSLIDDNNPKLMDVINRIGENARESLETMREVIWASQSRFDNFQALKTKLLEFCESACAAKYVNFYWEDNLGEQDLKISPLLRRNIFLVIKESVNNALKYSNCTELKVSLNARKSSTEVIISDNGEGFDPEKAARGNGIYNMEKRVKECNGMVSISSTPGNGTKIFASLKHT